MKTTDALAVLSALAQEHRLAIYRLLVEHGAGGLPAGVIGERLALAPATLSFHLKELSQARLIAARQDGRFIWYRVHFDTINKLIGYLNENCCRSDATCVPVHASARSTTTARRAPAASKRRVT